MESCILVTLGSRITSALAGAQLPEVLSGFWDDVTEKLHFYSTCRCLSDIDIHENDWTRC
jgi:hypothetical protein